MTKKIAILGSGQGKVFESIITWRIKILKLHACQTI